MARIREQARAVAIAVVCSLETRRRRDVRLAIPQLAGSLTEQDRTPRRFDSSTTATSPNDISPQCSWNFDGDDDFERKHCQDLARASRSGIEPGSNEV